MDLQGGALRGGVCVPSSPRLPQGRVNEAWTPVMSPGLAQAGGCNCLSTHARAMDHSQWRLCREDAVGDNCASDLPVGQRAPLGVTAAYLGKCLLACPIPMCVWDRN